MSSSDDLWIVVPNWDKFQHYADRDPPWIKAHLSLKRKPEYDQLSLAELGLLLVIWLAYAETGRQVQVSQIRAQHTPMSTRRGVKQHLFESLNHAGLIELSASKPLALREEKRREYKNAPVETVENPPRDSEEYVRGLIQNGALTEAAELDAYTTDLAESVRAELRALLEA